MATPVESSFEKIISDIYEDICEEKCILLIGPEIIQIDDHSLLRHIHEQLRTSNPDEILHYYEQDTLFLFKDDNAKFDAPRFIKRSYEELTFDQTIYRKILEIPFHFVISLNPDIYLPTAASGENYSVAHQFSFFRFNGEASETVQEPQKDYPLFYNLFGCITEDESLILDYEDLFQLLRTALGPDGLPTVLRKKLKEARSFLFLGFEFEKWYSQLLLQLLTGERKGRPKFALNTSISNTDAKNFLLHQFRIEFLGDDAGMFDTLYQHCSEQNILRQLKEPIQVDANTIQQLRDLIGNNEIPEAINLAERLTTGSEIYDWTIQIKRRFNDWKKKKNMGTLRPWEEDEINRISNDLLELINQITQA